MGETRATVFGLDVWAQPAVPVIEGATAQATGRRLDVAQRPGGVASFQARDGFELICDQVEPDGTVSFRIEAHPDLGYLLSGPRHGVHLLSVDGRNLQYASGNGCGEDWQRLLVAQVLPLAAILRGLEVLHASAVVIDRQAVAFVGPSRSGKTSVALELCRQGAGFLADDVLALDRDGVGLVGHPGSPAAGVDHAEVDRLQGSSVIGETLGVNERERIVRVPVVDAPAPVAALFFLDRRLDGPAEPRFEPITHANVLLAATFNFVLASPDRLVGLLDVCALAAQKRVERILLGPSVDASRLGAAVAERLGVPG